MVQAYISYHRAQGKLARALAHRLSTEGLSVWWDRGDRPGDKWSEAAAAALSRSTCIIVLWSKAALRSPWILGEATAGFGRSALVNVVTDKLLPPAPFHEAPAVEMIERGGEFDELGWIRLRDLVRQRTAPKLPTPSAEVLDEGQGPQRPARPPPKRIDWAPAPVEPPKRSGGAPIVLATFVLAGLAGGAWYARDQLPFPFPDKVADLEPADAFAPPPPPSSFDVPTQEAELLLDASAPEIAPPEPERVEAVPIAPPPESTPLERGAQPTAPAPQAAKQTAMTQPRTPVRYPAQPYPTYSVTLEQPGARAPIPAAAAPSQPPARAAAAAPSARVFALRASAALDLDPLGGGRGRGDLWLSSSKARQDIYLGSDNGARFMVLGTDASRGSCERRRPGKTLVAIKTLRAGNALCIRTSEGRMSLVRIEAIEGRTDDRTLRLRVETY